MSRKKFIESNGATCNNWRFSWSFINEAEKFIIFGAWDFHTEGDRVLIFSEDWQFRQGRKRSPYKQSREHIRLIEEEGFTLKTLPLQGTNATEDEKGVTPTKIRSFTERLDEKVLSRDGGNWYAADKKLDFTIPEEVDSDATCVEGALVRISVNGYERNWNARKICIDHHGYDCAACGFNFEKTYGSLGEDYIHVHHLVPIHTIKEEYEIDPVNDLIPVCPNCHAMIHREKPTLTIDELKKHLAQRKSGAKVS